MSGVAEVDLTGKKDDTRLYFPLLEQVPYGRTQAYVQAINRLVLLGLSEEEAISALEK